MILRLKYNVDVDKSVAAFLLHLHFLFPQRHKAAGMQYCICCRTRIVFLLYISRRSGMTLGEIERLLKEKEKTREEQIRIIRKERGRLLEEIHGKQQQLDRLDYMLYEMKKK